MVFGFFYMIRKNGYDMFHVTAITQAIGDEYYLAPQVEVAIIAVNLNQENYFQLERTVCLLKETIFFCSPNYTEDMTLILNCMVDTRS